MKEKLYLAKYKVINKPVEEKQQLTSDENLIQCYISHITTFMMYNTN